VITVANLRMRNWACFRGEHELALRPTQYAVVARSALDPDRSNWNGKSRLMCAVDWALWGRIPEDCRRKADLVTRGEKSCEVGLELSDGHVIKRALPNGPEKLWLFSPGADPASASMGDEAQGLIEQLVGLSREDFLLAYMRQREMARLVTMDPGPRMELVSGWIRLAPLEACEAEASDVLAELARRVESKRRERSELEAVIAHEFRTLEVGYGFKQFEVASTVNLESAIGEYALQVRDLTAELERLRAEKGEQRERASLASQAAQFDEVVRAGRELAATVANAPPQLAQTEAALRHETAQLVAEVSKVEERIRGRRAIASGNFDGECPFTCDSCPAAEDVVKKVSENQDLRERDARDLDFYRRSLGEKESEFRAARDRLAEHQRYEQRLADLREVARSLKSAKERYEALREPGFPGGAEHDMSAISNAEMDLGTARAKHAALEHCLKVVTEKRAAIAAVDEELAGLERASRTAAAAVAIFGKGGAQRRIAEGVLADIERRANEDVLAASGVELSVRVLWSRETSGLAAACGACGTAYPASRRVRECPRCGAERGPQLTNKLELEPSDRSGAADDLAGFAFQVGASAWLREDRLAGWGVAMLDEPVAALDAAHRRAFGRHLPGVLSRAGFGQALVIAHHASVLDALPARIEIVSDGKHSTVKVVG
jgi:DNA repair exonuclease SbcCD ATPase subunit